MDGRPLPSHSEVYTQAFLAECGGEPEEQAWAVDAPLGGFLHNTKIDVCLNVEGCKETIIYDACTTTGMSCMGTAARPFPNQQWSFNESDGSLRMRSHGPKRLHCLPVHPKRRDLSARLAGTVLADSGLHKGEGACATVDGDGRLATSVCAGLAAQGFAYERATGHITSTADGRCLTAAAPPPPGPLPSQGTIAIGRKLGDGGVAMLLLNNEPTRKNVNCDAACFGRLGWTEPASRVSVRDVWRHAELGETTASQGWAAELAWRKWHVCAVRAAKSAKTRGPPFSSHNVSSVM